MMLREQIEAMRVADVSERDEVMEWDNRGDIYSEAFSAGFNRALDVVLAKLATAAPVEARKEDA